MEAFGQKLPPPHPPLNGGPFVVGEIGAGLRPQYAENLGEVVLTLGAGDIREVGEKLVSILGE